MPEGPKRNMSMTEQAERLQKLRDELRELSSVAGAQNSGLIEYLLNWAIFELERHAGEEREEGVPNPRMDKEAGDWTKH